MNEYLIIGAGLQGEAIAYDVLKFDNNSRVTLADKFLDNALKERDINLEITLTQKME
jgi:saccharopine dehydrogenase-like NADP-dependent oxidoreductase